MAKRAINIQDAFNAAAAAYDQLRRTLIPYFDDFYSTAVSVIPYETAAPLDILDLCAGTGLYSGMVQAVFPNAKFTLVDLAEAMLEQAKTRFSSMGKSPSIVIGGYLKAEVGGSIAGTKILALRSLVVPAFSLKPNRFLSHSLI